MSCSAFSPRVRLSIVGLMALGLSGTLSPRDGSAQDSDSLGNRRWRAAIAGGASFFWGAEGNTTGLLFETGVLRRVRRTPVSLRGDIMIHHYGTQSVAPCLVSANETCFPLMQRSIGGLAIGAQYAFKPSSRASSATPYLLGGLATYVSTRVATRPPSCSPGEACANVTARHTVNDIDYGVQIGAGTSWLVGRREFYLESKYHHRVIRDHKDDPFTSFRFSPIALGVRF